MNEIKLECMKNMICVEPKNLEKVSKLLIDNGLNCSVCTDNEYRILSIIELALNHNYRFLIDINEQSKANKLIEKKEDIKDKILDSFKNENGEVSYKIQYIDEYGICFNRIELIINAYIEDDSPFYNRDEVIKEIKNRVSSLNLNNDDMDNMNNYINGLEEMSKVDYNIIMLDIFELLCISQSVNIEAVAEACIDYFFNCFQTNKEVS